MGFSSFLSSKSNLSIPAYPYAEKPAEDSHIVLVLPDDRTIIGYYDGYGKIHPSKDFIAYVTQANVERYHESQAEAYNIWDLLLPFITLSSWGSNFNQFCELVKIVRFDEYQGEKWKDLKPSPLCPNQGYFY